MKGWIKLHRQLLECDLWINDDDEPFDRRSAWVDLLLRANHKDKQIIFDNALMTVGRGQLVTSVRKLADRWRWSNDKTLKYLRLLESLGMITRQSDNRRTLLTIVNYEVYQDTADTEQTQISTQTSTVSERKANTDRTQISTQNRHKQEDKESKECLKNEKNDKEEKKNIYFPNDEALNEAFKDFVSIRKKIKAPLTDRATSMAIKELEKLGGGDSDLMIRICNQTVLNSWKGFYPLKEQKAAGKNEWLEKWENA